CLRFFVTLLIFILIRVYSCPFVFNYFLSNIYKTYLFRIYVKTVKNLKESTSNGKSFHPSHARPRWLYLDGRQNGALARRKGPFPDPRLALRHSRVRRRACV